ncbi:MAG: GDP-6-deoxy-D-mannose reductase [Alphaproteobacteria bacterium MarineAlpha9_Bin3]|nr:MAG: GDP-6-deoxy-D-mannose reductase [Alphaproteobacteria bacterium MarineAlpha9_Bin3]|tara:strand:- start:3901 stop:4908 length:1008 start_codon:yes stop_codon:yes gene_type:complete
MKNKNVLITGAEGFIGSHLCEVLVKTGANVKALVLYNSYSDIGWLNDLNKKSLDSIEIIFGDIRDQNLMIDITKRIDTIFHLAALIAIPYSYKAPKSYIDTNVLGTLNVLQASNINSVKRLISTSTSEVYGSAIYTPIDEDHKLQAQSPYSASKIAADHLLESFVKSFNTPAVILRPFNTYGPRQSERAVIPTIIRQVLDNNCKVIKTGDLSPKRDFNYVLDTVDAFIKLAELSSNDIVFGSSYNAGSGKAISIEKTLQLIKKITNSDKKVIQDKNRLRPKKSEVNHLIASSTKIHKSTNWLPKTNIEVGLEKTISWWEKRFKEKKINNPSKYYI